MTTSSTARGRRTPHSLRYAALAVCLGAALNAAQAESSGDVSSWPTGGRNLGNTRNNEVGLTAEQARKIELAWTATLQGDPWTQPTVAWGKVFVGTNRGWLYAFDAVSGAVVWQSELRAYWDDPSPQNPTNVANDPNDPNRIFSNPKPNIAATRTAPAARDSARYGHVIYIGDQAGNSTLAGPEGTQVPFNGANIYMIDADNGRLLRMTKIAENNGPGPYPAQSGADFTILTGAMALYDDTLITGVSGLAEANPKCSPLTAAGCTFRGRIMAFDADTLKLKWETYTSPKEVPGYSGGAVWQSTPSIDPNRGLVYVGTGDNYTTPYDGCYREIPNKTKKTRAEVEQEFIDKCITPFPGRPEEWARNHFDSVLALDLKTGAIRWSKPTLKYDSWTLSCFSTPDGWVQTCGPDMDFAQHPMLCEVPDSTHGRRRDVLVIGHKTGDMLGLNPDTGEQLWRTDSNGISVFNDGLVGGFQWGSACVHGTVIGLAANSYAQEHSVKGVKSPTRGGSIVGFDVATGKVKFETLPATDDEASSQFLQNTAAQLRGLPSVLDGGPPPNIGAASCAGNVCGWGTSGKYGSLLLTDIKTGKTLWTQPRANGSVLWGGAFVRLPRNGVFWFVGSGYASIGTGMSGDGTNPNFFAYRFSNSDPAKPTK